MFFSLFFFLRFARKLFYYIQENEMSTSALLTTDFVFWKRFFTIASMKSFLQSIRHRGRTQMSSEGVRQWIAEHRAEEYKYYVREQLQNEETLKTKQQKQHVKYVSHQTQLSIGI